MASQDKKQFSDIIGLIYESAQNPDLWPELLFHIDGLLGSYGNEEHAPHISVREENSDLMLLRPHFQRAIEINKKIYGLQTERNSISDILDRLPMGILLVDTKMSPVAMNKHARSILQSGKLLAIKNGMLVANSHKNTSKLQHMIMQTAELMPDIHNDHLNHSLLLLSPDASPCSLHIVPSNGTGISSQTNVATVLIASSDIQQAVSTKTLSELYALTQMEARVLKLLMNGCHSLTEVTQKLGISKYTTRSHMKVIFEKTGTHSQAELLKKVLRHPTVFIGQKNSATAALESLKALDIKPHRHSASEMFKMITLHDGRNMEYREYGSPTGTPVIFLHSMIHSRKIFHPFNASIEDRNIRLIAPERPGYGASDMMPAHSVSDYAKDITQLADHLGIACFYIVGDMDSSAYALGCACHMPERILKAVSISCCLPYSQDDSLDTLVSFERTMMFLMRKTSVLIPHLGRIVIKALKRDPDMYLERFGKELCEPDKQVFETEEHRKIFRETFANIMPENVEGFLDSYFTPLHTWDFDPEDIQVPVQLWHGVQDQRSSVQFAKKLAATIPVSDLHFIEHGGHFIFHTHWEQMLDTLLGGCPRIERPTAKYPFRPHSG